MPREVFAAEEKAHLSPPPQARFDVPAWSQAKVHGRVPPGKRSADPNEYPRTKTAYALRSVYVLVHAARGKGEHVGAFAEKLLSGPLPWSKMRQAQALMRLCDRRGTDRVEAACARAIAFDVYDVPRIERMLKLARWPKPGAEATGKVVRLPGRFARAADHFTTQWPKERRCAAKPSPSPPNLSPL